MAAASRFLERSGGPVTLVPDKGTLAARRVRKARGLTETAQLPKEIEHDCVTYSP
jgi:hypothetical protein